MEKEFYHRGTHRQWNDYFVQYCLGQHSTDALVHPQPVHLYMDRWVGVGRHKQARGRSKGESRTSRGRQGQLGLNQFNPSRTSRGRQGQLGLNQFNPQPGVGKKGGGGGGIWPTAPFPYPTTHDARSLLIQPHREPPTVHMDCALQACRNH